jgi:hypothetical protein
MDYLLYDNATEMTEAENRAGFISHLIEGNNAMVRGDLEAAIDAYHRALELNPKFAMTYSKIGQAYYKKKDYDKAIRYYKTALDLDPKQTETLYRLGKAYGDSGMMIQAAVAFDLARERDTTGDLHDRIEDTERRIRRHSTHGSLRRVSSIELLRDTAMLLGNHLPLFIPSVVATIILAAAAFAARWVIADVAHLGAPVIDFTQYLFATAPKLSYSTMLFLASQLVVYCFVCVPILGVETALVGRLSAGREASFDEAISRSFGQISSLAGVSLLLLIIGGVTSILSSIVFKGFTTMFHDFFRFIFDLRVFVLPVTVLVMVHFTYIFPSIIIDRRKMESGLKKSIAFATRFYWFTFIFICFFLAIHFWVVHFGGLGLTPKFLLAQTALVISQAFFIAGISLAYTKGYRAHQEHRSGKAKESTGEDESAGGDSPSEQETGPGGQEQDSHFSESGHEDDPYDEFD